MQILRGMVYGAVLGFFLVGGCSLYTDSELLVIHAPGQWVYDGTPGAFIGTLIGGIFGYIEQRSRDEDPD